VSLKQEIDRRLGVDSKIRIGAPGALDVLLDGEILFSAKVSKRMPTSGEILALIASHQASG
jgi:hypothetical protein